MTDTAALTSQREQRGAEMAEGETPRESLAGDLGALLSSGSGYDVTIVADGVWLPAHRAVLAARSPVFAAMFRHDLLEASKSSVTITDINQEVLRQLLQFMYTDEVPLLDCVAAELLIAADKYCVPRLKQRCEQQLIKDLCVESAADSAVIAMVYSCKNLKGEAISFIHAHYVEVMATDGWANAMREHTEDVVEICRLLGEAARLKSECGSGTPETPGEAKGSLSADMLSLLDSGEGSDVTVCVGVARLAAHGTVLAARSPVLATRLKEAEGGVLAAGAAAGAAREAEGRLALRFVYGDALPPPAAVDAALLALADDWALHALKEHCERQLALRIQLDDAVALAVLATNNYYFTLEKACVHFIRKNIFDVMCTAGWAAAIRDDAEAMVKISRSIGWAHISVTNSVNYFTYGNDKLGKKDQRNG